MSDRAPAVRGGRYTARGQGTLGHLPALDGLRGLAVLAVLAFHHGFSWAKGGFLGVSTFFTLSGFLITMLLLAEWRETGRIDLVRFWGRRARRLLPGSLLCLAGVALLATFVTDPSVPRVTTGEILAALGQVANWRSVLEGSSYADLFTAPSPVQHFWSLAIEEQFYALFPLAVALTLRRFRSPGRAVTTLLAVLLGASATAMVVQHTPGDTRVIYYATHTRAAELLAGALLAVLLAAAGGTRAPFVAGRAAPVVAALGAVGLAGSVVTWATTTIGSPALWEGGILLYAAGSAAVVAAASVRGPVRALLGHRLLRAVGRISYGVYLFHWPVFLWFSPRRLDLPSWPLFAVRVGVTFAVAVLSFLLVEVPIRYGRGRSVITFRWLAPVAMLVVALLAFTGGRDGDGGARLAAKPAEPDRPPPVSIAAVDDAADAREDAERQVERVLFVGDSLLGWGFEEFRTVFEEAGITSVYSGGAGTGPLNPQGSWLSQVDAWVEGFDPDVVVFESCCNYVRTPSPDTNSEAPVPFTRPDGTVLDAGTEELYDEWERAVRELSERAGRRGALVVWVLSPPMSTNGWYGPVEAHAERLDRMYRALDLPIIDWTSAVTVDGAFVWEMPTADGGSEVVRDTDGLHLTAEGSRLAARFTLEELRRIAGIAVRAPAGPRRFSLVVPR